MTFTFGKPKKLKPRNALQSEKSTAEQRKRFMLKCASGGFGQRSRTPAKISLAPVSFLKDQKND